MKKKFALGDVLSVTGNRLVSPRGIEGVYDVMNFLTGASLYTHQLLIARESCRDAILRQRPDLASADDSIVTPENWREWVAEQVSRFGAEVSLEPMDGDAADAYRDPVGDLERMVGKEKVIKLEI